MILRVQNFAQNWPAWTELAVVRYAAVTGITISYCDIFSEREHVRYMSSSVRLSSVWRLVSVTFVHPTQAIEIFGNCSTPLDTAAIH